MEILSFETLETSFEKENKFCFLNEAPAPSLPGRAMLSDITKLYLPKKSPKIATLHNENLLKKPIGAREKPESKLKTLRA